MGVEVFHTLKGVLKDKGYATGVGDEGADSHPRSAPRKKLSTCSLTAIQKAGLKAGKRHPPRPRRGGKRALQKRENTRIDGNTWTSDKLIDFYDSLDQGSYPIISIEDGLAQNDWKGWKKFTDRCASKIQIVGDDIFVTNPKIFMEGISKGIANSILIKLNQIGTVTENPHHDRDGQARRIHVRNIPSVRRDRGHLHRRPRRGDEHGTDKDSSASRSERIAKYNQLMRIESELGDVSVFGGADVFYSIKK